MNKIFLYIIPLFIISCSEDNTVSEIPVISFENIIFSKLMNGISDTELSSLQEIIKKGNMYKNIFFIYLKT